MAKLFFYFVVPLEKKITHNFNELSGWMWQASYSSRGPVSQKETVHRKGAHIETKEILVILPFSLFFIVNFCSIKSPMYKHLSDKIIL